VLYAFLGQQLASVGVPQHEYSNWIYTYSAPEFEKLAQQLETLAERYTSATTQVYSIYRYAMLCERDFFEAAWMVD
jgi:thiaminase/transcriptional activator TenA